MESTRVVRIPLTTTPNLHQEILDISENLFVGGYRLASSVMIGDHLILIYQRQ